MTDEQTVHLNPGTGTPGQVIRNLYFNGKPAYRMGFPEFAYPSLFIVGDQIGSSRTTVGLLGGTGSSGPTNFVTASTEFYPFGAYVTAPATNLEQQFTGKIRDVETGNDYFGARYYSSSTGRFMSPDWSAQEEPVPYGELDDPQSLNLYVYVRNNPLSRTDNYGHSPWGFAGGFEGCDGSNSCQPNLQEQWSQWSSQPAANAHAAAVQQQDRQPVDVAQNQTPATPAQSQQAPTITYVDGSRPVDPNTPLGQLLACTANCLNTPVTVTSTNEPVPAHPADTPHGRGEAADLRVPPGQRDRALQCAANCGAGFGQNEYAHPVPHHTTGGHVHVQTGHGRRGGRGDLPRPQRRRDDE
ncbi:MAG TPA: RHS repeat-associated core domain-containing protein [Acidisarcina sp.]